MRAMIFAAGLGTRLKPFTLEHPKALVPVAGVPMLQRVIMKLKYAGINEFVVNVHHFAEQIIDFLKANDNFGTTIHISDESSLLLDTGGGILAAKRWLDVDNEPFVVHNADILTDFDINGMIGRHTESGSIATLLVSERDTSRYLLFNHGLRLSGWTNVKTGQVRPDGIDPSDLIKLAFGGIHVMSPSIFTSLSAYRGENVAFSITDFYIDNCSNLQIMGYKAPQNYEWHDIGKPESLSAAEKMMQEKLK